MVLTNFKKVVESHTAPGRTVDDVINTISARTMLHRRTIQRIMSGRGTTRTHGVLLAKVLGVKLEELL